MSQHPTLTPKDHELIEDLKSQGLIVDIFRANVEIPSRVGCVFCPGPDHTMPLLNIIQRVRRASLTGEGFNLYPVPILGGAGRLLFHSKMTGDKDESSRLLEEITFATNNSYHYWLVTGEAPCLRGAETEVSLEENFRMIIHAAEMLRGCYCVKQANAIVVPALLVDDNGVDLYIINR